VLKTGGKFISITFAQKHFGNNFHYYYYVIQKGMGLSQTKTLRRKEKEWKKELQRKVKIKQPE
jgi:hypothetical protein